jgi:hypothetical protein
MLKVTHGSCNFVDRKLTLDAMQPCPQLAEETKLKTADARYHSVKNCVFIVVVSF